MSYAELHCLSNFTFLRGASHPHELVRQAAALGYRALAITDECSMAGIVRAWEAAREIALPLIVGTEVRLEDDTKLVLLAENHAGYTALCRLITQGRRRSAKGSYRLGREDFDAVSDCCVLWVPGREIRADEGIWVRERFAGNAWIAIEMHRGPDDAARLERLRRRGAAIGLALVAAGDVHMHVRARRRVQDTLTAIRHRRPLPEAGHRLCSNGERHLRPLAALERLYPPELLRETLAIAERCRFSLDDLRYEYPHELVPEGETPTSWLRKLTEQGARRRWAGGANAEVRRLIEHELALIADLGYEPYFLTVYDIVAFARSRDILCQGRGSAANSVVCYCLGITEVDPARMSMLFARFVSRERTEPPDIDVDFESERREEVIQHVYSKYGRHRAALAATVITYRPRSAIRDVGKALGLTLDQVDQIAKSVAWWDEPNRWETHLQGLGFDPGKHPARTLIELTRELIGFPRHLSQHVGGFVISERPLHEMVAVENAAMAERTIIQWDKDDLDALGMLKVDCLGLGMLTAIRRTLALVSEFRVKPFALQDIPAEDPATYDMICRGETTGVFQIESRAQMSMLPRLRPRCFSDLVIEVAIIRPGPIQGGMVHPYLRRRQGLESVTYPSEALRGILQRTLGVPLFQEQVMQIAMVAAGFTPDESDQVRRSMAAWRRRGGLERCRERLCQGMAERGYSPEFIEQIYQQILGFGSYGFPESHAASFALLTYVSCWLKCHEPAAFFAALLNSQPMGFYAPAQLVGEARRCAVELRPVDVLASEWDCSLESTGRREPAIRLGLRMVSGLPEAEGRRLPEARCEAAFLDVDDLVERARLSRRGLNRLADAGALRSVAGHRHAARWAALDYDRPTALLSGFARQRESVDLPAPTDAQEMIADYRSLGLTLGRHPIAFVRRQLEGMGVQRAVDLQSVRNGRYVQVAGLVTHRQRPETASGVIFMTLEDESGPINLIVWPKVARAQRQVVLGASLVLVGGVVQSEQGVVHVVARRFRRCDDWLAGLDAPSRDFH